MTYLIIGAVCFTAGFYVCIRLTLHTIKKGKLPRYLREAGIKPPEVK